MVKPELIARKKSKQTKSKMDWSRVEELLAEKLADRVKIKLKIRESDELENADEIEDAVDEGEFSQEELDEEINSREIAYFFIHRHINKIHKVG
ncbi:hypothetical protein HN924_02545 [Candidatus Woesearchaeota archaeon]|jgi:hypothetical protein|nr:hypothetical protein [Candidatus Woesearchaeota archaeon]MBT7062823.1 hypothetical protein [Candidatus Woesearchaeota archaeon]MBT7402275.1 hypothetical protein [Candidatus Woesearchaeota archaeon]